MSRVSDRKAEIYAINGEAVGKLQASEPSSESLAAHVSALHLAAISEALWMIAADLEAIRIDYA